MEHTPNHQKKKMLFAKVEPKLRFNKTTNNLRSERAGPRRCVSAFFGDSETFWRGLGGPFWGHGGNNFGVILGVTLGIHAGVILGSPWNHVRTHVGITLASCWGHFGVTLGIHIGGHFGVALGS